nr:hypothetical protein [uncultured Neisseria sp.]
MQATACYNYSTGLSIFFENKAVILPGTTGSLRDWNQWLPKLARFRPRDLIKAVQELIKEAKKIRQIKSVQDKLMLYYYNFPKIELTIFSMNTNKYVHK